MNDTKDIALALVRSDLSYFMRGVFSILFPDTKYVHADYIDLVAYQLMHLRESPTHRLIVNLPPRHLKSTLCNVAFAAWLLGQFPSMKILCISYSPDLAVSLSKMVRQVMESPWYKSVFPSTVLSASDNTQDLITTIVNGSLRALSVNGAITGFGADCIIIDDPQKADEVNYPVKRIASLSVLKNTILTRLNDPKTGIVVLIQQRLHEEDWSGAMIDSGNWHHLSLPAIAETDEKIDFGQKLFLRACGEPLHPFRMPKEELDKVRAEIGAAEFSTQYQQHPVSAGTALLDMAAFRRYKKPLRKTFGDIILHSWDLAYTQEKHSDYSVLSVWIYRNYCLYLHNVARVKKNYADLKKLILVCSKTADIVVIEGGAMGTPLWQELRQHDYVKYKTDYPKESKEVRLMGVRHLIETGRVWLPTSANFLPDFLQELANFPNSKHDDQVDSFVQALRWVKYRMPRPPPGWSAPDHADFESAA